MGAKSFGRCGSECMFYLVGGSRRGEGKESGISRVDPGESGPPSSAPAFAMFRGGKSTRRERGVGNCLAVEDWRNRGF